ncbi:MAG: DUF2911 domain-containing protein [Sphingobacteriales bacterium]|nr:MAG: DUF2911 domain-containing protein [Sphingobacteriales bacterium]
MKKILQGTLIITLLLIAVNVLAQNKPLSPPDTVTTTTSKGVKITIAYSRPSIRGRKIGKEIAPYNGQPWRTGANEQTIITVDKAINIEGHALSAGKYSIWTIPGGNEWTVIINKNTTNWGTDYDGSKDVFRFKVKPSKAPVFHEVMKFSIDKSGRVALVWGEMLIAFVAN